jgi:hypothetical protein
MNLILDESSSAAWYRAILPRIREIYTGTVITTEQYDTAKWEILDRGSVFAGYDCIGLTLFPRKEYDGVSDMRSIEDYREYVEAEAATIDMLAARYNVTCKLAVPMGLDYWQGSYPSRPHPDAPIVAQATDIGLDILRQHNFTGVFISHWASEPDHFGENHDVESMLKTRWTETG